MIKLCQLRNSSEELPREDGHNSLFSESVLKIGKIHRSISNSYIKIIKKSSKTGNNLVEITTDYGWEIGQDEMDWWINKNEENLPELLERTEKVHPHVETLRQASKKIRKEHDFMEYEDFIQKIKKFVDDYDKEITELLEYTEWLKQKGEDAPAILFSYKGWGTSRRSERFPSTTARKIIDDESSVKYHAEIALGFVMYGGYQIGGIYWDLYSEAFDELDLESAPRIGKKDLFTRTENEIMHDFEEYFHKIRDSVNLIILETKKKIQEQNKIFDKAFLKKVISFVRKQSIVENNLWDFKATLDFWEIKEAGKKTEKQFEFAQHIVSYANSNGGIIIVGITDKTREIVGITNDLEDKIQSLRKTIEKFTAYDPSYVELQQIILENEKKDLKECLVITIKQTKDSVPAISESGLSAYSIRLESGKGIKTEKEVREQKKTIHRDNFDFVNKLEVMISD